jgi:hypothetical protein
VDVYVRICVIGKQVQLTAFEHMDVEDASGDFSYR